MSKAIQIFPFTIVKERGDRLFQRYVQENKEWLNQKYGRMCFVGGPVPNVKVWSYYEVDVVVLDDYRVEFHTYDMRDPVYGGRGNKQEVIEHRYDTTAVLAIAIEEQRIGIATLLYKEREAERLKRAEEQGILAVYKELFPS